MHDVEIILNHIHRLIAKEGYQGIGQEVIDQELEESYCDLEISMALMAIIIRKLCENQFLVLTDEQRQDVNALIHSNRFDYQDAEVMVYSRLSQESIHLDYFLDLGAKIINDLGKTDK